MSQLTSNAFQKGAYDNIIIINKIYLFSQIEFQYLAQKTVFGNDSVLQGRHCSKIKHFGNYSGN